MEAVAKESWEKHPRNKQSGNTAVPINIEDYITEVSEEVKARVTKKLSQEFTRTEKRILGTLSKLDEFLLKLHVQAQS